MEGERAERVFFQNRVRPPCNFGPLASTATFEFRKNETEKSRDRKMIAGPREDVLPPGSSCAGGHFPSYAKLVRCHTHLAWIALVGDPDARFCSEYLGEIQRLWLTQDTEGTGALSYEQFLRLCDALCASRYDWDLSEEDKALLELHFGEDERGGITFRDFLFWSESEQGLVKKDEFESLTSIDVSLDDETGQVAAVGAQLAYAPSTDVRSFTFLPWDAPTTCGRPPAEPLFLGLLHLALDAHVTDEEDTKKPNSDGQSAGDSLLAT